MSRAPIAPGTSGVINYVQQVKDDDGRWLVLPEGESAPSGAVTRWRASVRVRDVLDGKVHQLMRHAGSKAKAENMLKTELRDRQVRLQSQQDDADRAVVDASRTEEEAHTVGAVVAEWLDLRSADPEITGSTYDTYAGTARVHVLGGQLAETPVRQVSVQQVTDHLSAIPTHAMAKLSRTVLRGAFDHAVANEWCDINPVRQIKPLKAPKRPRRPGADDRDIRRALTAPERASLLVYAEADEYAQRLDLSDLIAFLAGTGVRLGEALALRWSRVDLDQGTALIAATTSRVTGRGLSVQDSTKTAQDRTVHLAAWLVDRLRRRRELMSSTSGDCWGVVFGTHGSAEDGRTTPGRLRDRSNTSKQLRHVYDGAGFRWMSSHSLRRTAATMMDDAGLTTREIANALGHAQIQQTYAYLDRRASPRRMADVL